MARPNTVHANIGDKNEGASVTGAALRSRKERWLNTLVHYKLGVVGAAICLLFLLMAILAPRLAPYDPLEHNYRETLQGCSTTHLLGTDDLGRDTLSRLILGARVSLRVGVISTSIAFLTGIAIGLVSGYWGGWVDSFAMRLMDALFAFPTLVLAIAIISALGTSLTNAMLAIGIVAIPRFARLIRGQVLSVREREFIVAARAVGAGHGRIMLLHILPSVLGVAIVQGSLTVAFAILAEATLSFLGLGAQPPTPSWGSMLRFGYPFLDRCPTMAIAPGVAITLTVLGICFVGDALQDLLNPQLKLR